MRLIGCHIENFGKLQDRTFSFTEGLNTIQMENGAGKSTLATFIKVMLFGFDNETKRDELENERKRYMPWQGGVYGGTLSFEADGKKYEIERTFKAKEKDDTFVIRDMETLLEVSDYDTSVGEQLFGINRESFKRSAFISQNACESEISDSINAKMGNLVDNTDDMNRYEVVMHNLDDMLNKLTARKKTGELNKLNSQINEIKVQLRAGEGIDDTVNALLKKSEVQKAEYNELKKEQEELTKKQKAVGIYKDAKANKEKYDELIKQTNIRKENYDAVLRSFKGEVPKAEDVNSMIDMAKQCKDLEGELKGFEKFDLDDIKARNKEIEEKIDKYELKFATGIPTDSEISRLIGEWGKRSEIKSTFNQKKATLQTLIEMDNDKREEKAKELNKGAKTFMITGVILLLIGIIIGVLPFVTDFGSSKLIFFGICGICIVAAIVLIVMSIKRKNIADTFEYPINPNILIIREELEQDDAFIRSTYTEIEDFFIRYNLMFDEYTVVNELYNLKNDIVHYEELKKTGNTDLDKYKEKEEQYKKIKDEYDKKKRTVTDYISSLGYDTEKDALESLLKVKDLLKEYDIAKREYEAAADNKTYFEEHTPDFETLKELKAPENDESMAENETRLKEIQERVEVLSRNIESYKRELDDYRNKKEEISNLENALLNLEEQAEVSKKKYDTATRTKEYMEQAKLSLTKKYTGPITEGFYKYYSMLEANNEDEKYVFDAHINLNYKEQGQMRNPKTLSQGLKDLTGIALRMAFIDAMYQDEKPFVIFDDPYVNLDGEKLDGGLKMLKAIADEHQIIYFTCHDVRVPV